MEVIKYPSKADWPSLVKRPALDVTTLFDTVRAVLNEVRSEKGMPLLSVTKRSLTRSRYPVFRCRKKK